MVTQNRSRFQEAGRLVGLYEEDLKNAKRRARGEVRGYKPLPLRA